MIDLENVIHVIIGGYDNGRMPNVQQYDQNSRVFVCRLWKAPAEMYMQPEPYAIAEGGFVGVVFKWRGAEPTDEYETELVDHSTVKLVVPGAATQRKGEIEMQLVIHENGGVLHGPKMIFTASESLKSGERVTEPMLILERMNQLTREAAAEAQAATNRVEQLQIDASGLAGDSNKLGGKPPEYYLPAVNLLGNSDFRASNFIAQAGFNVPHGSDLYVGDRWLRSENIVPTSATDGIGLSCTDMYAFIQQRVKLTPGKTYTVALCSKDGAANRRIAVFNKQLNEIFASVEGGNGVFTATFVATYEEMAILFYPAYTPGGGSALFEWAVLFEGEYNADTLPPFVPPAPTLELAKCRQYYRKLYSLAVRPYNVSSSARYYRINIDPPMSQSVNPTVTLVGVIETPLNSWADTGATFAVTAVASDNFTISATGDASETDFVLRVDAEISFDL